jgi:phosphoglycerate kinase
MLSLDDLDLKGKNVFLRVDFNVPLDKNCNIRDDTRIQAVLPTIQYLIEHEARIIAASHLGRPKGKYDPKLSLKPVAERLSKLIDRPVQMAPDTIGDDVERLKDELQGGDILLLENLRFYPGEKENDPVFAKKLAKEIDFYVNDAFGACHREHASVVGITQYVQKSAPGFLVKKELDYLQKAILSPNHPYVAILGGAKVSDKIPVIESLLSKADIILIGGAMAYTFFAAKGKRTGRSLVEEDKKELALLLLEKAKEKGIQIILPEDHIAAESIDAEGDPEIVEDFPIPPDLMALDIGPKTIQKYSEVISSAKTIFWNGPMGVFEVDKFAQGTTQIAEAVANSNAFSIVGGGDSVAAVYKAEMSDKISHISTGGGAALEFITKETLPGIEALTEK